MTFIKRIGIMVLCAVLCAATVPASGETAVKGSCSTLHMKNP